MPFFFSAPPSNMALAKGVPGPLGKRQPLMNPAGRSALLPTAPVGLLLMRVPALYQRCGRLGSGNRRERAPVGCTLLLVPHTYILEWHINQCNILIDGHLLIMPRRSWRAVGIYRVDRQPVCGRRKASSVLGWLRWRIALYDY
jgi:hypothetical protein